MRDSEEEICQELAEISIKNGLLQLSSWQDASSSAISIQKGEQKAPEVPESILPRVVWGDFEGYLSKFGNAEVGGQQAQELLKGGRTDWRALPSFLFKNDFVLNNPSVWKYVFGNDDTHCWAERAAELETLESVLEDEMLEEISRKYEALNLLSTIYQNISKMMKALSAEMQKLRAGVHEQSLAFKYPAESATVLKQKQHNLRDVLNICEDISSFQNTFSDFQTAVETMEGMEFPRDDFVLESFQDLQDAIERLGGTYSALKGFKRPEFGDKISKMLHSALYFAIDEVFKADCLRGELARTVLSILDRLIRYTADDKETLSLALQQYLREIINGRVRASLSKSQNNVDNFKIDSEYFSNLIQDEKSITSLYEGLQDIFDDTIKICLELDSVIPESGSVQWEFERSGCQCFLRIWVYFLSGWSESAKRIRVDPYMLKDLLDALDVFELKASSAGVNPASSLAGPRQGACRAVLDSTSQKWAAKISEDILLEKWKHTANIDGMALKFSEIISDSAEIVKEEETQNQFLVLGGRKYGVIESFDYLLDFLVTMRSFAETVPSLSPDIGRKVVEILRQFNSQTCQLVLGAGAMQSAGLKSITVKNLAISCQQLDILLYITTSLQTFYAHEWVSASGLVLGKEFDRCMDDIRLHHREIQNKIVNVTCDLMIPLVKDASIALSTAIRNGKYEGVLLPAFTDLVDAMMRNFLIVATVIRSTLSESDVLWIFESIWEENIVWIRDGALSFDREEKKACKCYIHHLNYVKDKLADYPLPSCIIQLIELLDSR